MPTHRAGESLARVDRRGWKPLHHAAVDGSLERTRTLLDADAKRGLKRTNEGGDARASWEMGGRVFNDAREHNWRHFGIEILSVRIRNLLKSAMGAGVFREVA